MTQLPAIVRREKPPGGDDESSPIVRIQKTIFEEAMSLEASDVHIEPGPSATRVRYRVHGLLRETLQIPGWMHSNLVARIKILSSLDISERRLPQDGRITAEELKGADVRVSTLPTRWGEKIVMRILRRSRSFLTLSQLDIEPGVKERLQALIRQPQGILLVAGPTGSGKTTTLYAFINEIRTDPLNIVTIEDPVEYAIEGVNQVQVNEHAGLTFAKTLRSILRQDPDVILLGEIRDSETAITAFHAAMTGHLVFSTLHATDSISALLRASELGVDRSLIGSALIGIVAQRLVRLNCTYCMQPDDAAAIYLRRLGIDEDCRPRLRQSPGCPYCASTGTRGRSALFEFLEMNRRMRQNVASPAGLDIRDAAETAGLVTMTKQAVRLTLSGSVSVREAYRTCYFGED